MGYLILSIGLLLFTPTAYSQSDVEYCADFKGFEQKINKDLPRKVDEFTELISVSTNCDSKVIKYVKRILVSGDKLQGGWQERKQRQHTQLHCNKDGLSSVAKWVAMDVVYDKDYKYLITLETRPNNCR